VDAEQHLRESLAFCRNSSAPIRHTAVVLAAFGRSLVAKGALAAAEPILTESLELRRAERGNSHPVIAESLVSLSSLRLAQKRCGDAISLGREAVAMSRRFLPEHHLSRATAGLGLARALQACGEAAEATPLAHPDGVDPSRSVANRRSETLGHGAAKDELIFEGLAAQCTCRGGVPSAWPYPNPAFHRPAPTRTGVQMDHVTSRQ